MREDLDTIEGFLRHQGRQGGGLICIQEPT
jgi:hypothetical protein